MLSRRMATRFCDTPFAWGPHWALKEKRSEKGCEKGTRTFLRFYAPSPRSPRRARRPIGPALHRRGELRICASSRSFQWFLRSNDLNPSTLLRRPPCWLEHLKRLEPTCFQRFERSAAVERLERLEHSQWPPQAPTFPKIFRRYLETLHSSVSNSRQGTSLWPSWWKFR